MSRLALLTGGSRGIGRATADMLRARGWDVLAPTRDELDFDDISCVEVFGDEVYGGHESYDGLNALIICHGTWYSERHHGRAVWREQFVQRVEGPWLLIEYLHKRLRGGSVTVVSSTQAFGGRAETGPYGAACAAQVRLMAGLAQSKDGIRYNTIACGLTQTDMAAQVQASGDCRPDAVPQPVASVAAAIVGLVEGDDNGVVLRVVDGQVTRARWVWE